MATKSFSVLILLLLFLIFFVLLLPLQSSFSSSLFPCCCLHSSLFDPVFFSLNLFIISFFSLPSPSLNPEPAASSLCSHYCPCCNTEGVSSRNSQKQSPQIGSPDGAVSVHLEETRFNRLSDHPPPVSLYPHLHLHIESMSVSISLFEPSHRLLLTATQKGQLWPICPQTHQGQMVVHFC